MADPRFTEEDIAPMADYIRRQREADYQLHLAPEECKSFETIDISPAGIKASIKAWRARRRRELIDRFVKQIVLPVFVLFVLGSALAYWMQPPIKVLVRNELGCSLTTPEASKASVVGGNPNWTATWICWQD